MLGDILRCFSKLTTRKHHGFQRNWQMYKRKHHLLVPHMKGWGTYCCRELLSRIPKSIFLGIMRIPRCKLYIIAACTFEEIVHLLVQSRSQALTISVQDEYSEREDYFKFACSRDLMQLSQVFATGYCQSQDTGLDQLWVFSKMSASVFWAWGKTICRSIDEIYRI